MAAVLLAFNRYMEMKSSHLARQLFSNTRMRLWLLLIPLYGLLMSGGAWDLPPIYNSEWSVFLFQIDLRTGAAPVLNRVCFFNSCWVTCALITIYSLVGLELKKRMHVADAVGAASASSQGESRLSRKQRCVNLQSFLVCLFVFMIATTWIAFELIQLPLWLSLICIVSVQVGSGAMGIVYIALNDSIRAGVKKLLCGGRWYGSKGEGTTFSSTAGRTATTNISRI